MSTEQIKSSLDAMLETPKSKNFLNHMVRSYFPIGKVNKVLEKPTGIFKCALSREPLVSISEINEITESEEFKKDLAASLKVKLDGTRPTCPFESYFRGQKVGFTGKDTTTFLSYDSFQTFYDWVMAKQSQGDKHINWLLNGIRHEEYVSKLNSNSLKPKTESRKVASFKLGDANGALADLKAKMEKQGL